MKKNQTLVSIIGVVAFHMIASIVWYQIFMEQWLEASRLTIEQAGGVHPIAYVYAMVAAGAAAYMLVWLFNKLNVKTPLQGAQIAFFIGVSIFLLQLITQDMLSVRPMKLSLINGGNYMLFLVVAGAVLGKWRNR